MPRTYGNICSFTTAAPKSQYSRQMTGSTRNISHKMVKEVEGHRVRGGVPGARGFAGVDGKAPPIVVAIAHQMGCHGEQISNQVAGELGLPVFDRRALQSVAERVDLQTEVVWSASEQSRRRLEQYLASHLRVKGVRPDETVRQLVKAVVALWHNGPCILVGHGCVHLVPKADALIVHLMASEEFRVQAIVDRMAVSFEEARQVVQRMDEERNVFHEQHFALHVDDPQHYDLTLDTASLNIDGCAAVIIAALRAKFRGQEICKGQHELPKDLRRSALDSGRG